MTRALLRVVATLALLTGVALVLPRSSPAAGPLRLHVSEVLRASWGSDSQSLGESAPFEGNPECPMSFAVGERGQVFVVDQVNGRMQIFEGGRAQSSLPLPSDAVQDIELDGRGGLWLLDRLVTASVFSVDGAGRIVRQVPVVGAGVPQGGGVTGLFRDPDGVRVEYAHQNQALVVGKGGEPVSDRKVRAGRLSRDGKMLIEASMVRREAVALRLTPTDGGSPRNATLRFTMPVFRIDALEGDASGQVFLAVDLLRLDEAPPYSVLEEREVVVVLEASGREVDRLELPPLDGPDEQFRPVRLGADGALYQLRCEPAGAVLRKVSR